MKPKSHIKKFQLYPLTSKPKCAPEEGCLGSTVDLKKIRVARLKWFYCINIGWIIKVYCRILKIIFLTLECFRFKNHDDLECGKGSFLAILNFIVVTRNSEFKKTLFVLTVDTGYWYKSLIISISEHSYYSSCTKWSSLFLLQFYQSPFAYLDHKAKRLS